MVEDAVGSDHVGGFITDMVYSSIKEVNFYEVAEHFWEDNKGV